MSIVTASALASWLSIPDTEDDSRLASAAAATNLAIVRHCGRTFTVTTSGSESARTFKPKTWSICYADDFRTTTNLVVKTDQDDDGVFETTLSSSTDYFAESPEGLERALGFPYRKLCSPALLFPTCNYRPSVQVTAAWGWSSVPADVTLAGLIKGAALFKRKDSSEGVLGGFADFAAIRIGRQDPDVVDLLRNYRTTEAQGL